jgi:outer membrane protein
MKNLSLILNVVLLLLVGNLYYQGCNVKKTIAPSATVKVDTTAATTTEPMTAPEVVGTLQAAKVVYVNIDSINEKYSYIKQQKASLERLYNEKATSIRSRGQQFQQAYMELNEKAQKGTVPPAQIQAEGQKLEQQQQSIMQEQQQAEKDLQTKMQSINENLLRQVTAVLEQKKREKGFDYVMSYSKSGVSPVLNANPAYDITNEVLATLNAKK